MYTVVVADDEEEIRRALIRKVDWEEIGFVVVGEAENGAEALEMVELLEPDLLLTDIKMPFISGIELARMTREIRPAIQIAFLSGYDDFTYAKQAIQYNVVSYLLKPISSQEITAELRKIKEKIDQKFHEFAYTEVREERKSIHSFLIPLVLDNMLSGREEKEWIEEAVSTGLIKGSIEGQQYLIMVTSIVDKEGKDCKIAGSVQAVNSIIKKYYKYYYSFYVKGRVVSVLVVTNSGYERYAHILVEDIIQNIKRILGLDGRIGVSRPIQKLGDCHEAYVEAVYALQYSMHSDESISFIADVEYRDSFKHEELLLRIEGFERVFRSGTMDELEEYLKAFFAELVSKEISPALVQFVMIQLLAVVFRISYTVLDSEKIQSLEFISPMQGKIHYDSYENIWSEYMDFCLRSRELILNQRKTSTAVIIEKALEIIETQYSDVNLSLNYIGAEIGISPNYLSALIKKETGNRFIDLLTRKRVEKARELLLGTSLKVKEISELCGYSDQQYFSYSFKKYTGYSPNSCRRQNEEKR